MKQESFPTHADIVVAGGGPAGATIASLLARFGYHVVVLEKRQFPRHQIGESLTPQILPILDFVGIRQQVEAAGFLRMIGHTVCWGSAEPRTSYYSPGHERYGFQAWREDFDTLVLAQARAVGVHVYMGMPVEDVTRHAGQSVVVRTARGNLITDFFIDATGHAGILARQQLRQRDEKYKTLAITGYWRGASGPTGKDFANTMLETYRAGLVWSVPLHNGLRNVTVLVDWDEGHTIRRRGLSDVYAAALQQAPHVSSFLSSAQLARSVQVFDASWYTARSFAGAQFLLVGDAGLFIDPLSSEGVHKAMASAITGAIVVNTILKRPSMVPHAVRFYDESQQMTYLTHYQQAARYYGEERRWEDHPFWQKRNPQSLLPNPTSPQPLASSPKTVSTVRIAVDVRREQRPVIEGDFVEMREVVVARQYPRGIRMLLNVNVAKLLEIIAQQSAVQEIIAAYLATPEGMHTQAESVRQVLARLYQEGLLVAADRSTDV